MTNPNPLPPLVSFNPTVSMEPKHHYTTQSAAYDRLIITGPLTDERIEYYEQLRKGNQVPTEAGKPDVTAKIQNRAKRREAKRVLYALREALGLPGCGDEPTPPSAGL